MSDLIPEINWTDFQKIVKDGKIGELMACNVNFNSELMFIALIPHGDVFSKDGVRTPGEMLALRANISGGVDPSELLQSKEEANALV